MIFNILKSVEMPATNFKKGYASCYNIKFLSFSHHKLFNSWKTKDAMLISTVVSGPPLKSFF